jgi:hypothetical protein
MLWLTSNSCCATKLTIHSGGLTASFILLLAIRVAPLGSMNFISEKRERAMTRSSVFTMVS